MSRPRSSSSICLVTTCLSLLVLSGQGGCAHHRRCPVQGTEPGGAGSGPTAEMMAPMAGSPTALLPGDTGPQAADPDKKESAWEVNAPPGPKTEVQLDLTSGTWMSLDVSPDGSTLVFDLLGDLYSVPMAGGEAKSLSSGMAWDMQPKFSPDGRSIAFTSDRGGGDNIWVMRSDGTGARQVTEEKFRLLNSPTWSPDGQYIAARKHFTGTRSLGSGEIWLYHHSGGRGCR